MATQIISGSQAPPTGEPTGMRLVARVRDAAARTQISTWTAILLSANLLLLLAVCVLFAAVQSGDRAAAAALRMQGARMDVANEFGRTSDQLTRVARASVVTGEARYERYYDEILAIRDGRQVRPQPYGRGYWNLVVAGRRPAGKGGGRRVPLLTMAREAGYAGDALALLGRARNASDALNRIERDAMRNPQGGAGVLFSDTHNDAKAAVMEPLDELLQAVEAHSDRDVRAAQDRARALATSFFATLCAAATVAALSAWRFMSRVVRPLSRLSAVMDDAGADDDRPIPYADRADEIGRMARALAAFRAAAGERDALRDAEHRLARRREEEVAAHRVALGDAGRRSRRAGAMEALVHRLSDDLGGAMTAIGDATGELNECAQTMTRVAHATQGRMAEAEAGGRDTAAHVDSVAATCRQLAHATSEIERQTERSIASADEAVEAVRRTGATVAALTGQSERIQGIVALIARIATKTNRLAINATIEAAHAGPAGRGFAVVAAEVKSLARQTAAAAEEISDQLGEVRRSAHDTAAHVDAIARGIADTREISKAIGGAVERQGHATGDISLSADLAARRTRDCADMLAAIRTGAGHTHGAIARVMGAVGTLAGTNDAVRAHVDRFATEVREI